MKRAWIAASCLLACIGIWSGIYAQPSPDGLVSVPVQITDRAGNPVTGLALKDFRVLENSAPQEIKTFAKGEIEGAYVIGYSPAQNPKVGFRPIEVIVNLPNVRVRTIAGYYPSASK